MPEYKGVYFTPDGQWFASHEEAKNHEKTEEIAEYICECFSEDIALGRMIAQALIIRYTMEERHEYAALVQKEEEGQ